MSPTLKAFYIDYNDWLNAGAPEESYFCRSEGLCSNIERWGAEQDIPIAAAYREMIRQFAAMTANYEYPFETSVHNPRYDYNKRAKTNTQHLNPNRIEWVRKHAEAAIGDEYTRTIT